MTRLPHGLRPGDRVRDPFDGSLATVLDEEIDEGRGVAVRVDSALEGSPGFSLNLDHEQARALVVVERASEGFGPEARRRAEKLVGARPVELPRDWHEAKISLVEGALLEAFEAGRRSQRSEGS